MNRLPRLARASAWPRSRFRAVLRGGLGAVAVVSPLLAQADCGLRGQPPIHACIYPGEGPTLVLAAGAGQDSRTWAPLIEELLELGTIVTFDRPGLGRSPDAPGPRTPTAIAREIRGFLHALGVSEPVLLVGHSMGGIHALRYTELFPDGVSGVVLLDTPPRDFEEARMETLTPEEREARRRALAEGRARAPRMVGRERDGAEGEPWDFRDFPRDVPLVVVVADGQNFGDLGSQDAHRELWVTRSRQWLEVSPHSELVVATGSGHMVHRERPELVLEAVRRMVEAVR